jgi:phospho-2-dehydro-3-deoxyheptonate aldolase
MGLGGGARGGCLSCAGWLSLVQPGMSRGAGWQVHRELTSGLSMAVGFKNGTNGDMQAHGPPPATRHTAQLLALADDSLS